MANLSDRPKLDLLIQSLLKGLRLRIRAYVWLEGLTLALIWIGLAFWLSLGIDYLPVLLTASEFPWHVRAVLLATTVGVLGIVLYRWVLRRAFVRLADHSMALLLERRYGQFHDSLVTAVELSELPDHAEQFNREMLVHTNRDALNQSSVVRLREIFNLSPLIVSVSGASMLAVTIGAFAILHNGAFLLGASRIYLLSDVPWPRRAKIEVVGVEVQRRAPLTGQTPAAKVMLFRDGRVKVGKGSSVVLKVRAEAKQPQRVVPKTCTIVYRTEDGDRGRQNMQRIGRARDGYQLYTFDGKPFKGILSSVEFDVVGYDDRVNGLGLDVVDNPTVVATQLECVFPAYMVDLESTAWTPRTIPWTPGARLPRGTRVTIHARANKPLRHVYLFDTDTGQTQNLPIAEREREHFSFSVPPLDRNLSLEITLHDMDDVTSESSQRIFITSVEDEPPIVNATLRGIGIAVTPDVLVPVEGKITDDYAVGRAWIDIHLPNGGTHEHEIELGTSGRVETAADFRTFRDDAQHGFTLMPGEDSKLVLSVKAADRYDLTGQPNIGSGDRYELDVVTADQLLALLDREEAGLRRRVEQIYEEMSEARDYLLRVRTEGTARDSASLGPGDGPNDAAGPGHEPGDAKEEARRTAQRLTALRALYAQRALLQTRKSAQEVLGVSGAFRDIRQQLINNRIDAEDRKSRLENEIAGPLQHIGQQMFADLDAQIQFVEAKLKALEQKLDDGPTADQVHDAAVTAVKQADDLLAELEKVLNKLIKFETYAELLDIVRHLIDDQDVLIDATRQQQKKDAQTLKRDLLE